MSAAPRAAETDTAPASYGHRSQAIVAGGLLFTGGQIGAPMHRSHPRSDYVAEGTFEEQVITCLHHLDAITIAQGSTRDRVVVLDAFVAEPDARSRFERTIAQFFATPPPLVHYRQVSDVALHGLVELDWVVSLDNSQPLTQAATHIRLFGSDDTGDSVVAGETFLITNGVRGRGATMTAASEDAFAQIANRLEPHGGTLRSVLKMTVYIDEFDNYPQFNAVTQRLLTIPPLPTRSVLVSPETTADAAIRIDILAQI
jgi:2-iminobutanoate/2-iminopropanoate deaminase